MPLVAIIDDRENVRIRLAKRVSRHLKKQGIEWKVDHFDPLPDKKDYTKWIINNKIVILIVDERLKDQPINGVHSTYNGHDLVEEVRKYNKQLPIYIITAHSSDSELENMKGEIEDVISRTQFSDTELSSEQYVKRFIRATQTYLKNFEDEYKRLAELAELVALNKADNGELNEIKALQTKMQLPLSSFIVRDRKDWLEEIESKTDKLEELKNQLEQLLKGST